MDHRVKRITEVVRGHDRQLFAYRSMDGKVLVMRQGDRLAASDYNQSAPDVAKLNPQLVFALTDTWRVDGIPVEWGLEPILDQLKSRDAWAHPDTFRDMVKTRDRVKADQERSKRNEIRGLAADLRREFASATNDINTSTVEKVDRRRVKDGHC